MIFIWKCCFLALCLWFPRNYSCRMKKERFLHCLIGSMYYMVGEFTCINSLILHSVGMYELFSSFLYQKNLSVREINIQYCTTSKSLEWHLQVCNFHYTVVLSRWTPSNRMQRLLLIWLLFLLLYSIYIK